MKKQIPQPFKKGTLKKTEALRILKEIINTQIAIVIVRYGASNRVMIDKLAR